MKEKSIKEACGKVFFAVCAVLCIVAAAAIFLFIVIKSVPALQATGLGKFLLGQTWAPDANDVYGQPISGSYGILPMLTGTLTATVCALLVGGTLGFFTAVFLAYYCKGKIKTVFSSVINLLAGVPSVIFGFFGIKVLMPLFNVFSPNGNSSGLLLTSVILGMMIFPTVASLSKTALEAVPAAYYEGALALGATRDQAVFRTVVPAARSGVTAAMILGVGRALGETMAVVMVAGNSPQYPHGLFSSFRTLTANIVLEMGYAGEVQMGALFATGGVLLAFVAFTVILLSLVTSDKKNKGQRRKKRGEFLFGRRLCSAGKVFGVASALFALAFLCALIVYLLVMGLPHFSVGLLFGDYQYGQQVSIWPSVAATLMTVGISLVIALPLGICAAVFLSEYAGSKNPLVRIIRSAIDILSGVPSIVYGLFGAITFVKLLGGSYSIAAGSLTVSVMLLPTVIRATEESLRAVPMALREGALALGAGKLRTIFTVVLPSALPGIVAAAILSVGRVMSESAPFMFTMGSSLQPMPEGAMSGGTTLAVALYYLSGENLYTDEAFACACVLMLIVLALNVAAEAAGRALQKKFQGEKNASRRNKRAQSKSLLRRFSRAQEH